MLNINKITYGAVLFFVVILVGCQNNVEIPAELVTIIDNYPKEYTYEDGHNCYSRQINLVFKIKNTSGEKLFIPISDWKAKKYYSYFSISSSKKNNIRTFSYYWKNKSSIIDNGDSLNICVKLMEKQLRELGLYTPYFPPYVIIRKVEFRYIIDVKDFKLSKFPIPQINFYISPDIKYIYQKHEGS
ncbi:hypothetical protein PRBRB14_13150 [Hallella multisaccharivorax DSM 17128]|jgi:hypothetical protein|uniref:Lipoprotein n=1 Tax=Hallella multisaccharivorax DSM 17128 TaxID=688246 RepID=F8NBD6_9BACT|nr:hypothetical protein [Hallella multisaccharivorax]EGN56893.1 hypothetical protein Premu_1477 [Hallella multisaccharivorax DSM 17128]GJG30436.1 hypothetical protein PRBRB14_13150 [Hallella multisaccharivorax DSM 17128]